MGNASNQSKQLWNARNYTQVKISVSPDIAASFKARCSTSGVSMASEISRFMCESSSASVHKSDKENVATRQRRRKALKNIIMRIETIRDAEQQYIDNFPVNLQSSPMYEVACDTVSSLDDALNLLYEAY